jgi:hypothetical protein
MEFFYFTISVAAGAYFLQACAAIARELNGIRNVMETHCELEPLPVRAERTYKRKGVEL